MEKVLKIKGKKVEKNLKKCLTMLLTYGKMYT